MHSTKPLARLSAASAIAAATLIVSATTTIAADPSLYQVRDIKTGAQGSHPQELTAIGRFDSGVTLYFSASDGSKGRELWRSDATTVGTKRVKDIRAGSASSNPREMTAVGKKVYFSANDGLRGRELWVTDGTAAGTRRVKDIRPGAKGSNPRQLTAVGSTLFFTANDGSRGRELWKTDGTAAGTVLVRNINRASAYSADLSSFSDYHPGQLTAFRGRLFFSPLEIYMGRYDGHEFGQLWVSDGTKAGTKPFRGWNTNLDELDSVSWPEELTKVGSRLFFRSGYELYRSNGTELSTRSMGEVTPYELTNVEGTLYFQGNQWQMDSGGDWSSVNEGLWRSNGTKAGTVMVHAFPPPSPWCCTPGVTIDQLTAVGSTLFFTRQEDLWEHDPSAGTTGRVVDLPKGSVTTELTSTDVVSTGRIYYTVNGVLRAYQLGFGGPYSGVSKARQLTNVGGMLMFSATDGTRGQELWAAVVGD